MLTDKPNRRLNMTTNLATQEAISIRGNKGKVLTAGEGLMRTSVPGETLTYKLTAEDNNGAYDYLLLDVQPKSGTPMHIHHKQHESIHFLKGRYKVQLEDEVFYIEEGGFVYIPMGVNHAFMNISDEPGEAIFIFSPGGSDKFFEEFSPIIRGFDGPPDPAVLGPIFAKYDWELTGPPLSAD
jgi:quercetin dioxygenase-like cupin family protein